LVQQFFLDFINMESELPKKQYDENIAAFGGPAFVDT
jgi:hypothetical protein